MDDEFKLCWKNFQDNIASGFQNLYDRGDLVDVTLACDGKLLQAHKIVLAICSPYFQEIFTTNPCQHPIIILKDVSFNIMLELLEFMYQGVVNVKHTELQSFMKIGQLLQIKGLATNSNSSPGSSASEKSTSQTPQTEESPNTSSNTHNNSSSGANNHNSNSNSNNNSKSETDHNESKGQSNSRNASPGGASRVSNEAGSHLYTPSKRTAPPDFGNDSLSIYSGKQLRRSLKDHGSGGSDGGGAENTDNGSEMENTLNTQEFFMPPIPHISMVESRYDLGLKRESDGLHHGPSSGGAGSSGSIGSLTSSASSATAIRNPFAPAFNLDNYKFYNSGNSGGGGGPSGSSNNSGGPGGISNNGPLSSGTEYPNELFMPNDYSKNFANHMDIPSNGSNMVMLSTTSLLHGNCVFNRNNTVATQQGMKTYWLCKSYRISMCRARCITHLGRIISATGVHNHTPHMRGGQGSGATPATASASVAGSPVSLNSSNPSQTGYSLADGGGPLGADLQHGNRVSNMFANQTPPPPPPPAVIPGSAGPQHPHHHHHLGQALPNLLVQQHPAPPHMEQHGGSANLMHNPNLMHLQPQTHHHHLQQQQQQHSPHNPPQQHHLEMGGGSGAGGVLLSPAHVQQSPQSNRSSHSLHTQSPPPQPVEEQQQQQQQQPHQQQQQQQEVVAAEGATDPGTAHVINSITISPNTRHSFKMENM
ncbi:hypothetical protein KR200_004546 [Drosophila serrata]|nr:hypothetical protein KR200_004546 [Drosophila serrata]